MKYNCLIVDDEVALADSTTEYLNLFDVSSIAVYSAREGREFFTHSSADIILLDINLGDGSGFELCKVLRDKIKVPIIFISARDSDDDKIAALSIGGDDYISKPYSLGVLLAKIKAVLARQGACSIVEWKDSRLNIDFMKSEVFVNGVLIRLKAMEYKLLSYLVQNENRKLTKKEIFDNVWEDNFVGDGTLNVHIRHLRELIEVDANYPKYITTIWGEGYVFRGECK